MRKNGFFTGVMYILLIFLAVGFGLLVFFNYRANIQQMEQIQAEEEAASVTPTPPPTATPEPTPVPDRNVETITLAFAGDLVGQSGLTTDAQQTDGDNVTYDYTHELAGVSASLEGSSLAACTLVSTLTNDGTYDSYHMPSAMADALSDVGFQIVNVATDHILDFELTGLTDTVDILRDAGIAAAGAYSDGASRALPVATVNGVKVAYLSYTYGTGGNSVSDNSWCVDILTTDYMTDQATVDYGKIDADIAAVKEAGADIIVCFVYWWDNTQYYTNPRDSQVEVADYLCRNGVDIIIGGGVKSPQPIETRVVERDDGNANCVVCYSLSNLMSCFDNTNPNANIAAAVQIQLSRDADTQEAWISGVTARPLYMFSMASEDAGSRYRLLDALNAIDDYEAGISDIPEETYQAIVTGVEDLQNLMGAEYFVQNGGVTLEFPYEAESK